MPFQSTHPVWGATISLCGVLGVSMISIHAPRVGCDEVTAVLKEYTTRFQSTHPVWGATSDRAG